MFIHIPSFIKLLTKHEVRYQLKSTASTVKVSKYFLLSQVGPFSNEADIQKGPGLKKKIKRTIARIFP